jgi:hypothetical protein
MTVTAKDNPVYQLADSPYFDEKIATELRLTKSAKFADVCRKALGQRTKRALTASQYGAKLQVARAILAREKKVTKQGRYIVWVGSNSRTIARFDTLAAAKKFAQKWSFDHESSAYVDDEVTREPLSTYVSGQWFKV